MYTSIYCTNLTINKLFEPLFTFLYNEDDNNNTNLIGWLSELNEHVKYVKVGLTHSKYTVNIGDDDDNE